MSIQAALGSITALIVHCCDPQRVLLFGSYARGQDNLESDLDILVIGDFREAPALRGQEVRGLLWRYAIHIDLLLMTPEEVAVEARQPYGFLSTVLAGGVSLYEKASKTS